VNFHEFNFIALLFYKTILTTKFFQTTVCKGHSGIALDLLCMHAQSNKNVVGTYSRCGLWSRY